MKVYVVVGEDLETYGVFKELDTAQKQIRSIYENGYVGSLIVSADMLEEL